MKCLPSARHQAFLEMLGWSGAGMKDLDSNLGPYATCWLCEGSGPSSRLSRFTPSFCTQLCAVGAHIHGLLCPLASDGSYLREALTREDMGGERGRGVSTVGSVSSAPPQWLLVIGAASSHTSLLLDCPSLPEASCIYLLSVGPSGPYSSLLQARGSGILAATSQKDGFLQSCLHFGKLPL